MGMVEKFHRYPNKLLLLVTLVFGYKLASNSRSRTSGWKTSKPRGEFDLSLEIGNDNEMICFIIKTANYIYVLCILLLQMGSHANAAWGDPTFKGLAMTSEQPLLFNTVHPRFFPTEVSFLVLCILTI